MQDEVDHDCLLDNKNHSLPSKGERKHTWIDFALVKSLAAKIS